MLLYSLCSMGPVYVLLKIVLFLSSLNIKVLVRCSTTGENTTNVFNSSQGYFTKSVSHYDLVYPKKMMKNGKFLSHNVTNFFDDDIDFFKKGGMKRQIKETDELHYHVPMNNGEILKLALMPNYDIVGPSLLVEHKHADSEFNVGKSKFNTAPRKGCYYKGVVQNDPNSKVAVATCQGLAGFIKSKDGDFIIEPTSHFNSHDGSHGHIIFRKGKDFNRDDLKGSACGVKAKPGKMNKEQEEKTNDKMDNRNEGEQSEPEAIDQSQQSLPNDSSDGVEDEEPEVEEEEEGQTENIEDEEGVLVTKEIIQDTSTSASKLKKKTKVKQKVNDNAPHRSNYLKTIEMTTEFHTDINNDEDEDEDQELENSEVTTEDTSKSRNCVVKGNRTICSGSHDKNRYSDNTKIYKFHKKFKKIDLIGDDDDGQISHLHKKYVFNRNKKHKKIHRGKCLSKNIVRDEESKIYDVKDVPTNIFISTENKTTDTDGKVFDNSLFKDDKRLCSFSKKKTSSCNIMHSPKSKKYGNIKKYYPDDDDYNRINGYNYDNTDALTKDNNNLNDNDGRLYGNFNSSSKQTITDLKWFEQERGNKTTNSDNKIRRQIEYQSCNLPEKCKNKTECIWDVRITIVASYLFGQRHKDIDLETFILTIVNMVNRNFQDGSIGIMLNIKLVRMVFIEYKMPELDEDIVKLDELFENFCLFQYRINPYKSDHPNHHDVAIYIVSSSSCITNVIYGMSHQSSICNCQKSCILSFDEGLLLGNIITHQLGHSLGAEHDPKSPAESGCCGAFGRNSHCHMEPSITLNSTQWSKCSSLAIKNFIRTQGYKCLKQGTIDLDFDWAIQMLPGQIYNPVQQCSLNYHMPMLPCYTGDFCKHLYCQINDKQCISTLTPPAEGTPCAAHMWCIRGLCVNEGRYPYTINGEWNSWGQWSPCSRSCGGGVQLSSRLCNNPPPSYGGRYCIGKRIRYRMCNTDVCNQYALSFREVQCRETEEFPFRGQYYGWKAFYHNFEYIECSLLCESETGIVAVRQLVALDGTRCKPGTKNTCIAGKCMEVGCDWGINSGAITDSCGICHGNGTECKIIQGIYTERNNTGYVPFMKVPRGSGMIYARELNPSDLYIVVASYNTGEFYLNGPSERGAKKPRSGDKDYGSTRGFYSLIANMERIFIPGPTDEDLIFYAKFNRDKNFGIRYQFSLPEVNPCYIPTYSWQFTEWDKCSDACGGGQQKARPRCIEDRGGVVESVYCEDLKKPDDVVRSCNEFPCLPKWWVGSWSECIWVGKEELRYRAVLCMRTRDPSSLRNEILKDRYCCEEEKPDAVRRCNETLPRCVEKPTACDINTLTDEFPNIMNFDDLKLNFVSDEMDNEKNENSNKNKVKSEDTIIDQMPKQDDKLKDTELEFDNSDDEVGYNEKPSRIKENIVNKYNSSVINISELKEDLKNKRGMPHHFKNVYPVIKKDALAAEHLRKSASLKDSPRRMGLKRLHEIEAAPRKSVVKISNSNTTYSGVSSLSNSNKVVKNQGVGGFGKSSDVHLTSPSLSTRFNILRASVNNRTSFTGTPTLVSVFSSAKLNTIFAGASGAVSAHVTCSTQDPCVRTECPISAGLKCLPASQPLHKVLDQIILNMYKIAVIPIVCEKHLHRPSDLDYQSFQETSIWSVGAEANRTILIGESALQFILNARKNMSQIPFVYHAEN